MREQTQGELTLPLNEAIGLGVQRHRSGQLPEAEQIYRQILQVLPEQPDALHFLGLLLHQSDRSDEAIECIRRAIVAAPGHVDALNNLGNVLKERHRLNEAEAAFRQALALAPSHVAAHNNLGAVLREKGRLDEAMVAYTQAIRLQPDFIDAHYNLGHALAEQGRLAEATAACQTVLSLAADHVEAWLQLGRLHRRQDHKAEALAAFRQAIALQPQYAVAHFQLGNTLVEDGLLQDADEAVAAYRRVIECDQRFSKAYENLGNLLNLLGRGDEAAAVWQQWLKNEPDHPIARHMVAATSGLLPGRAEDGYVTQIFNDFAETFDQRLKQLQYRVPELVAGEVTRELGSPAGSLAVLDAGCGTGLCGPLLRPYARRLDGVDLSTGMLELARARGGYDELIATELTDFLARSIERYDLIASADTLVYFGDLHPILAASRNALRLGGSLIFTVERLTEDEAEQGFELHAKGRYRHSANYVRESLSEAGLVVRRMECAELRMEAGNPVPGFVVVACVGVRPDGAFRSMSGLIDEHP